MPTVFTAYGLRFYFYSNEHGKIHVHIQKKSGSPNAKIEVEPLMVITNPVFNKSELKKILEVIEDRKEDIENAWKYHFDKGDDHE